jgi:hypothetical protein
MKAYGGVDVYIHIFLTSALVGGEWSAWRSCPFTPGGSAPGAHLIGVWVGLTAGMDDVERRKSLTLSGLELRSLGRPVCSHSLYRLHYHFSKIQFNIISLLLLSLPSGLFPAGFHTDTQNNIILRIKLLHIFIIGKGTMLQAGRSRVRFPIVTGFFNWPNPSSRTMALGPTQPLTEMSARNLPGGKERPARKADNFIAICEPVVYKMWEPECLTTPWASAACCRDSFTFFEGKSVSVLN